MNLPESLGKFLPAVFFRKSVSFVPEFLSDFRVRMRRNDRENDWDRDMLVPPDDCAKRRLTDRAELTVAVEFLIGRGFEGDEIGVQLSRFYYVDIDELNDVLASLSYRTREGNWRHVA